MENEWSDEAIEKMRRLGLLTAAAESMKRECRDCGQVGGHLAHCEPYFNEEALREQAAHNRQEQRDGWQPEEAR